MAVGLTLTLIYITLALSNPNNTNTNTNDSNWATTGKEGDNNAILTPQTEYRAPLFLPLLSFAEARGLIMLEQAEKEPTPGGTTIRGETVAGTAEKMVSDENGRGNLSGGNLPGGIPGLTCSELRTLYFARLRSFWTETLGLGVGLGLGLGFEFG